MDSVNEALPSLEAFIKSYSAGPAALVELPDRLRAEGGFPASSPVRYHATSAGFSPEDEDSLDAALAAGRPDDTAAAWSITQLEQGRYAVCLGQLSAHEPANARVQGSREGPKDWLDSFSQYHVPGLDHKDALSHIDIIRKVDWSKTSLGPREQWSDVLRSVVGACLASPYAVLLAMGSDLTMIYNHFYAENVRGKHPQIMGMSYAGAWPEVWEFLWQPCQEALAGTPVYAENVQMFLEKGGVDLQECYYTYAMIPVTEGDGRVIGLYIPNFETSASVISERRLNLLRSTNQAFSYSDSIQALFEKACSKVAEAPQDLPLICMYDCSAFDDAKDLHSDTSSAGPSLSKSNSTDDCAAKAQELEKLAVDTQDAEPRTYFVRTAVMGVQGDSKIFPLEIPQAREGEDATILGTKIELLSRFRQVERTHEQVVLHKDDFEDFADQLNRSSNGSRLNTLVFLPLLTADHHLRAIAIVGLNPNRTLDDEYQIFLDLWSSVISSGITGSRLVYEEIRRARFMAALVKRKNEELHQLLTTRTQELKDSELKYHTMCEVSPAGIWRCDDVANGEITFANDAWYSIMRHPRDKPASSFLESIVDEDLAACTKLWAETLSSHVPVPPIEFRVKPRPGDEGERWCYAVSCPQLDSAGNIISVTGALTDVTVQKQRTEEAVSLKQAQERFIDMTSHEVRNPLSAAILSSDSCAERTQDLLLRMAGTSMFEMLKIELNESLEDLKIVSRCCTHITRLVDDILTLSKIDNSYLPVALVPSRPSDFVKDTLHMFKGEMKAKDIACELEMQDFDDLRVDWVMTDPSRCNQILINLITNAIKFTADARTRRIRVAVQACAERPHLPQSTAVAGQHDPTPSSSCTTQDQDGTDIVYLCFSVSDTGRGLTSQEAANLFQRFKQANPRTHISYGGSGLGLFICRRVAALLGGEIGVESERGKGSTFTFFVPTTRCNAPPTPGGDFGLKQLPGAGASVASSMKSLDLDGLQAGAGVDGQHSRVAAAAAAAAQSQPLRVLIVEDNLINQSLLKRLLEKQHCVCDVANHGAEAIDLLNASRHVLASSTKEWDCILMDIEMPVLDGMSTIKILRQMQKEGKIVSGPLKVLACTANARDEQLREMEKAGFDGIVSKPFKIPQILAKMKAVVAGPSR